MATVAAKTPTKEIGKYRGYSYCRQPKSDGKIHNPLAPPPPCNQWSRSFILTDVGVALVDEGQGTPPETQQFNFFDRPASTLFRENNSEYWNPIAERVELKYGLHDDESFSVVWDKEYIRFESKQERDRFFVDLSQTFQEWKTKYAPFQFSAGELKIDQRCLVGNTFVPCPSSTLSNESSTRSDAGPNLPVPGGVSEGNAVGPTLTAPVTRPTAKTEHDRLYGTNDEMSPRSFSDLANEIEAGKEVTIPIRLNSGVGINNMVNATVKLTKTSFAFDASCCFSSFTVTPDKILELTNQLQPSQREQVSRLHVRVAIKNRKGDKEDKKDFYLYNAAAQVAEGTNGYGPILCNRCDDSLNVLYALFQKVRGMN